MNEPLVSVIIPTSVADFQKAGICAGYVKHSTYKNIEVIIVNEGLERSRQRNIGIDRAKGKYLLFLDADQYIEEDLIADCVSRISYHGGIYIPEIIVGSDWFSRFRNWERQFYTGTPIDCVRFVRAYQCPKFDEKMSGPEDSDMDRRIIGGKVISASQLYHHDNVDIKMYFRKKAYYAKSMRRFRQKWPHDKILNFKYRCWTCFTENGKWKRLLAHPIMTLSLLVLIAARGVIYLKSIVRP